MAGLLARVHAAALQERRDEASWAGASGASFPWAWLSALQDAGVRMTPERALTISAVWAGVTFMARNIGSMPCITYERIEVNGKEGKQRASRNPRDRHLYRLLRRRPNTFQTAQEFTEGEVSAVILRGNHYARIVDGPRSFAEQLLPIHPDRVIPERLPSGRLRYLIDGGREILRQDQVYHSRGPYSHDGGVTGLSLVSVAAQTFARAIIQERYSTRLFGRAASVSLLATYNGDKDENDEKQIYNAIMRYTSGVENAGGVLVLNDEIKVEKLGITPQDAEMIPSQEHMVREVARFLGLPTMVLADAGKEPTHASAETFGLQLVTQCFRPFVTRLEQARERDLILEDDEDRLFIEFLMDALMRGDMKARAEYYRIMTMIGAMNGNEVRAKENMNPGPPELDEYARAKNMDFVGDDDRRGSRDSASDRGARVRAAAADRFGVRATLLAMELASSIVRREREHVERAAKKFASDGAAWREWVRTFYDEHTLTVAQRLRIPRDIAREYAARQGLSLQGERGIAVMDDWDQVVVPDLASLALGDYTVVDVEKGAGE